MTGTTIDSHLLSRMNELDAQNLLPKSSINADFKLGNISVRGKININEDGSITAFNPIKANDPKKLTPYINNINNVPVKPTIDVIFNTRANVSRMQYSLLKIGYLLTFAKFGYAFILDKSYDLIRKQLLNPNEQIFQKDFWIIQDLPKNMWSFAFVVEKGFEAAMPIFYLKTEASERIFEIFIPLPGRNIPSVLSGLQQKISTGVALTMKDFPDKYDYLLNLKIISNFINYIKEIVRR